MLCAFIIPGMPTNLLAWYQTRLPDITWQVVQDEYEGQVIVASSASAHLALRIIAGYGVTDLRLTFPISAAVGPICQPPADVPLPADSHLFSAQGLAGALNCIFTVGVGFFDAVRFYARELPAQGWRLAASNNPYQSASAFLAFTKDSRRVYINLFFWPGAAGPVLLMEMSITRSA